MLLLVQTQIMVFGRVMPPFQTVDISTATLEAFEYVPADLKPRTATVTKSVWYKFTQNSEVSREITLNLRPANDALIDDIGMVIYKRADCAFVTTDIQTTTSKASPITHLYEKGTYYLQIVGNANAVGNIYLSLTQNACAVQQGDFMDNPIVVPNFNNSFR